MQYFSINNIKQFHDVNFKCFKLHAPIRFKNNIWQCIWNHYFSLQCQKVKNSRISRLKEGEPDEKKKNALLFTAI